MSSSSEAPADAVASSAIETRGLSKIYEVYAQPQDRLKQLLWPGKRKFFQEFTAVRDVDLQIRRGECVGIVGRNGSGKSTLLKLICGLLEQSSGDLEVSGSIAPMLTVGAGFSGEFTGRENALLNASLLGVPEKEVEERMDSIIRFADIGEFFDQPVKAYSSGMYSRLAFAVAISANPDILVIDEVLAVGDEAFMRKCFARIEEIKQAGATILFVSHSAGLVIELCDRAVLMEGGERLLTSDPKTVVSSYHKLLYGDPSDADHLRQEIHDLDCGLISIASATGGRGRDDEDCGSHDPNLLPESTVEYERKGAVIENVQIRDRHDRRVNVLRAGMDYEYSYEVHFLKPARLVRFGMMIKLVTGLELAGQSSHPTAEGIERVEAETRVRVCFRFRAQLVPGAYFMNAGVLGLLAGEETYLHRILDVTMFRVSAGDRNTITGLADLSLAVPAEFEFDPTEDRKLQSA
jgi:lipopolysaccharide transport system ATP-binding protein